MSDGAATSTTLDLLRARSAEMTPALRKIADYVLANPDSAFRMSITELARRTETKSESTVVRFYRHLGFSSYHDFKVTLATELAGKRFFHTFEDVTSDDSIELLMQKFFAGAQQTLQMNAAALDPRKVEKAVTILEGANRIILLGQATSAAVAMDAYFKFSILGLNCHISADPHVNSVILADPRPGDVVFCVSQSGESKDVVTPVERCKPIAKVIVVTGAPESPLSELADVVLSTVSEERNYRTDAIISRIAQFTVVGVLFLALFVRRGDEGQDRLRRARRSLSYLKF
jgi:RpiR family transcriptional regulator, carbohydrate utilization regulator